MLTRMVIVTNRNGLHARPSVALAQKAQEFPTTAIQVIKNNHKVNASDVLQVLSLGAACGTQLTLEATGNQEKEALDALEELFKNNFHVTYS